jgi:ABC-type Mn2+/Zn2+ transport system ATPase subunit
MFNEFYLQNLCLSWPNGSTLLKNATFECYPGKVTAVIGQTGVGKSGLLLSLIQEILPQDYSTTPSSNKSLSVLGRVAYVSQVINFIQFFCAIKNKNTHEQMNLRCHGFKILH